MKKIYLIVATFVPFLLLGQTATSVQNGNWTNPMTWSCTCVPTPGYNVTIGHSVTLNTSFAYTSGSITINSSGALLDDVVGRDLWLNGGSFSNSGSLDVHYLLIQAGTFSNAGTITARAIANYVTFTNSGTFQTIDSLYNSSTIINNGSFTLIDSITNAGIFTNNGTCSYNQFTNTGQYINSSSLSYSDITNTGTFSNTDTITCTHSMWNTGQFNNMTNAYINVTKSMLNDDPIAHDAVFTNHGRVNLQDSWYNFDTIKGSGSFIVQDSSVNMGWMKNNFDFCDLTPPGSAPYIDFNTGTISPTITWCLNTKVVEQEPPHFVIFPNPASNWLNVYPTSTAMKLALYDEAGRLVKQVRSDRIDVSDLPQGVYALVITDGETIVINKIAVTNK